MLVWKLDRFSRSRTDSAVNKVILKKNGVRVVSAKESISDGPEGIILEAMLEGYAEYFSAELSEKVKRGLTENALKGKHNGGAIPLGYKAGPQQSFEIDPLSEPIVQEIYTRYADGETVKAITESLNERGLKSSRGAAFNKNSLHLLLKNRKYIGEYKYMDIVIPGGIPQIVSSNLFEKVQKRMEKNKKAPARNKSDVDYLLTTRLFCGHCESFMAGESGTSHTGRIHYYYKCSNAKQRKGCKKKSIRKELIESLVVAKTKELILQDGVISKLADDIIVFQQKESTLLSVLNQQLKEAEKGIKNMLDAIQQGIITSSTKQRLDELESRKTELEISIAQEQIQKPVFTKEQIVFWISRFKDGDIDDPQYRQSIIDIFVNAVFLYDDKMVLTLNYKDGAKTVTLADLEGSSLWITAHQPQSP